MTEGPVFFAGLDRSGIGLLAELFDCHPDVAVTRRTNFWAFYANRYGDLADSRHLQECLDAMLSYTRIRRLEPDVDLLTHEFTQGERTYPRLFRLLQEQNARRLGKARWGDKSLGSERHAEEILAAFPDATVFHVLRDPRDRHASRASHRGSDRGGAGSATAAWMWSARRATDLRRRFPERYQVVRYEDLVDDPEAMLTRLCAAAGLRFTSEMLQLPDGTARRIDGRSVGRHLTDLSTGEIRFIERVAQRPLQEWGYRPSCPEWGAGEQVAFLAGPLPVLAAGYLLWRPWTQLRAVRRAPAPRRMLGVAP